MGVVDANTWAPQPCGTWHRANQPCPRGRCELSASSNAPENTGELQPVTDWTVPYLAPEEIAFVVPLEPDPPRKKPGPRRIYPTNADRQRAYRQRKKAAGVR